MTIKCGTAIFVLLGICCGAKGNESENQFATLEYDLTRIAPFERFAEETSHPQALITKSDRDPLDIILRRTRALFDFDKIQFRLCGSADGGGAARRLGHPHREGD